MIRPTRSFPFFLVAGVALVLAVGAGAPAWGGEFDEARIYIEYNSTDNDLGFHVFLDGEDWKTLKIVNPAGRTIFEVTGRGAYKDLGMTELFFEGAEPSLDEFPVDELLALFPEGEYRFIGVTVDGERLASTWTLTHAVPEGPIVSSKVDDHTVVIKWEEVTDSAEGLPPREIEIAGYQVIVGSFQVTLPASSRKVTVPREYINSLEPGVHEFEVLAIEEGANQTITQGSFLITGDDGDDD